MSNFILGFLVFSIAMLLMAVGVMFANRPIKGSCGGLNAIDGLTGACDICELRKKCKKMTA